MWRNRSAGQGPETLVSVTKAMAPPGSPGWTRRVAYCLQVTLKQRLPQHAPGLTPTAVLEKLAEIKMIDVRIPTADQRWLILQSSPDSKVLIEKPPYLA
jgi:hypothetical protein